MFYWFIERLSPRRECEKRIRFRDPKASTDPRRWPCTASNNGLQRNNTRANMQIGKLHTFPSNAHCCDRNNRYFNICQSESAADVGWLHMFIRVTNFDRNLVFIHRDREESPKTKGSICAIYGHSNGILWYNITWRVRVTSNPSFSGHQSPKWLFFIFTFCRDWHEFFLVSHERSLELWENECLLIVKC